MALIKDGVIYRTYEEQVAYLTAKNNEQKELNTEQKETNEDFEERIAALEEGGGGEPPANMMTTDTNQNVSGEKTFIGDYHSYYTVVNDDGVMVATEEDPIMHTTYEGGLIHLEDEHENLYDLWFPTKNGTLAVTDDVKKYYKHQINMYSDTGGGPPEIVISGIIISSKNTPYTMADFISMGAVAFCNLINYNLIGGLNRLTRGSGGGICLSLGSQGNTALNMYYIASTSPTYEFVYSYTQTVQLDNTWSLEPYTPEEI